MYYGEIKKTDIADGEGVRVSLFVSGCRIHCKGCFNPMTWDFCYGQLFTEETEREILEALGKEYISGLTVLGGEPFEEDNQRILTPFLEKVRAAYPKKTIWCYTGYVYDVDLLPEKGRKHIEVTEKMLSMIDVLVDGPFIIEEKDPTLAFRGSRNQRILRLKH
ncbi:MAG: anaerobic ribonucleoside-triphosphate reductase activating protein [Treponema sp.]|jgi:anaerobic ribonucleoside-triphosphate reductase activating protein|nr:anaerobic ribonucleoside-triphosphate reductase activating protein [Treponema sp.]MBQ1661379.1 anaerobic ribonucleoside-triphosphate reductase activating protein [Treponema sp.]MBQ2080397.1 anaerobic ribonucleoside-triphosphate reductase activating protein [Treponema sp.]MBR6295902.1 anaerobic ribonucleoside-triphosphate reductase activating protein [Treponema sp.]MEE3313537.1 anaerobic ribonucleoside-triphosphate reductase activating protein [Treponema sp.]